MVAGVGVAKEAAEPQTVSPNQLGTFIYPVQLSGLICQRLERASRLLKRTSREHAALLTRMVFGEPGEATQIPGQDVYSGKPGESVQKAGGGKAESKSY